MTSLSLPSFPLQLTSEMVGTVRVCPEIAFADYKHKRKSGLEKKARKLLTTLQAPLEKFIERDETVLSIFRAQSHVTLGQQYMMGIMVYGLTAAVVVITDRRFIQLRVKNSNKWDDGIRACRWEHVTRAEVKGWLGKELKLHFGDGVTHRVWKLPRAQAKVLKALLPEVVHAQNQGMARPGTVQHLCPECKAVLTTRHYLCAGCKLLFKNEKKMRWLALLPGAAYFYCGKILLGVLDLFAETYVLIVMVVLAAGALLSTDTNPLDWGGLAVMMGFIVLLLAVDVGITVYHCQHFVRDFIPTGKRELSPEQAFAASAGVKT